MSSTKSDASTPIPFHQHWTALEWAMRNKGPVLNEIINLGGSCNGMSISWLKMVLKDKSPVDSMPDIVEALFFQKRYQLFLRIGFIMMLLIVSLSPGIIAAVIGGYFPGNSLIAVLSSIFITTIALIIMRKLKNLSIESFCLANEHSFHYFPSRSKMIAELWNRADENTGYVMLMYLYYATECWTLRMLIGFNSRSVYVGRQVISSNGCETEYCIRRIL